MSVRRQSILRQQSEHEDLEAQLFERFVQEEQEAQRKARPRFTTAGILWNPDPEARKTVSGQGPDAPFEAALAMDTFYFKRRRRLQQEWADKVTAQLRKEPVRATVVHRQTINFDATLALGERTAVEKAREVVAAAIVDDGGHHHLQPPGQLSEQVEEILHAARKERAGTVLRTACRPPLPLTARNAQSKRPTCTKLVSAESAAIVQEMGWAVKPPPKQLACSSSGSNLQDFDAPQFCTAELRAVEDFVFGPSHHHSIDGESDEDDGP